MKLVWVVESSFENRRIHLNKMKMDYHVGRMPFSMVFSTSENTELSAPKDQYVKEKVAKGKEESGSRLHGNRKHSRRAHTHTKDSNLQ